VRVELFDDVDGSDASKTAYFGWDGKQYEIDLNDKNYQKLEKVISEFLTHARYVGKPGGRKLHPVKTGPDTRAVREWAASQGITVSPRGKIPTAVVEQYREAGN
jgi:hypothetical protein